MRRRSRRSGGSTCTAATSWPTARSPRAATSTEGLPVLTVDEEIYRLAPAFVIATVDKFARLAREGEAASLFGYVVEALRPARLRAPGLPALRPSRTAASTRKAAPAPRCTRSHAAAAARPDHPGRAAPDHRRAGDDGRPVRGRHRRADRLAHRDGPAGPAAAGRLDGDRAERARAGPGPVRAGRRRSSRRRCSTPGDTFFSREEAGLARAARAAVRRDQHHRGAAHHGGDPHLRGAAWPPGSCCSTAAATPPTRT